VLGLLVLWGVERELGRPARGKRPSGGSVWRAGLFKGLRVAATFCVIALLWSLWASPSLSDWVDLLARGVLGVASR